MGFPGDRGAGACEAMTGHLPGKLLCCCNCNWCNSAATATVANVHRNYARSRHINCQFVEPPMWFSFAPSRLVVLLCLTLPGCLLLLPINAASLCACHTLRALVFRNTYTFLTSHRGRGGEQGTGTTDKSGPMIFWTKCFIWHLVLCL